MVKIIGLTGGIATGKSAVSNFLKQSGIYVIDADQITHQVEQPGQKGLQAIVSEFGNQILDANGELNRQDFAAKVFANKLSMKKLVRAINPFIRDEFFNQLKKHQTENLVVFDAPTLFENGFNDIVDEIIVVYCDPVVQMARLIKRNHLTVSDASKRINSQWPIQVKCQLADFIIYNSRNLQNTEGQVKDWLKEELN